jgi:hypothetical protein
MPDEQEPVNQEQEQVQTQPEYTEQTQEQVQEASEEQKPQPKKKDAEYNFAQLRKEREEAQRRAEEAERRLNDILELSKQLKGSQSPEQKDAIEEELAKLSKDDLATIDHVDKIYSKREKTSRKEVDSLKKELNDIKAQVEEQRFRARYPDLDEVITAENIELLKQEDPEIAQLLASMPQGSNEQVTMAYKYIKRIVPQKTPEPLDKKKAIDNSKKPISVQAIAKNSAIGNAHMFENGLTNELKSQLWKEMQDAMKRG